MVVAERAEAEVAMPPIEEYGDIFRVERELDARIPVDNSTASLGRNGTDGSRKDYS